MIGKAAAADLRRKAQMNAKLEELLRLAKTVHFTEEDKEAQRRSFAYGNTKIENDLVTWEMVDREAEIVK